MPKVPLFIKGVPIVYNVYNYTYVAIVAFSSSQDTLYTLINFYRPQVILGVTNPFFVKTLDNWPHLIRLADQSDSEEDFPGSRGGTGRSLGDGSDKPGVHTKYKPFLSRDKNFAKIISTSKVHVCTCMCVLVRKITIVCVIPSCAIKVSAVYMWIVFTQQVIVKDFYVTAVKTLKLVCWFAWIASYTRHLFAAQVIPYQEQWKRVTKIES